MTGPDPSMRDRVTARINYLDPGSHINRRFVAPAVEVNTGAYNAHDVVISNARIRQAELTLDTAGFTLIAHTSTVKDFHNKAEVEAVYPGEADAAVRAATGADLVAGFGWLLRTTEDLSKFQHAEENYDHKGGVQPPAGEVHVDTSPDRVDRMAQAIFSQRFPGSPPFRRYIYSSFWRAFSPPPQDCPLALCDERSVGADEGTPNTMFVVDKIPDEEEMLRPIPDEDKAMAAAIFHHNPNHEWWYYPDMTRDEALLFKFHDSRRTGAWRVPHTAFLDEDQTGAHPRASIEYRSIAYFL